MSKYTYESVSAVNIDVNNKGTLEGQTSAAKMNPTTFADSRLSDKTSEQQANILYSAVRDLGGDQNHPIVKALEKHMIEKSGIAPDKINDILLESMVDMNPAKKQEKAKPLEEIFDPAIGAPSLKEGYDSYKHVKVIDEQTPQKKSRS